MGCQRYYIGQTGRSLLSARYREHTKSNNKSVSDFAMHILNNRQNAGLYGNNWS
jgi:hypothetical protein